MLELWAAAAFFLAIHLVVAGSGLRDRIVGTIGEKPYLGLFSLVSIGGIVWLSMAYNGALTGPNPLYWVAPLWALHLSPLIILVAALFAVIGVTTANPTAVGAEVAIWALWHLLINGDQASIIFFGTFALLALLGTFSIDDKRERKMGEAWRDFASKTSNPPFLAIVAGRNSLKPGELGWWRILAGLIVFGALFYGHLWAFGVSPVPGWYPY